MNKCFDNKEMKKCSKDYRKVRGIVFLEGKKRICWKKLRKFFGLGNKFEK